jgi:hypothetical protein
MLAVVVVCKYEVILRERILTSTVFRTLSSSRIGKELRENFCALLLLVSGIIFVERLHNSAFVYCRKF